MMVEPWFIKPDMFKKEKNYNVNSKKAAVTSENTGFMDQRDSVRHNHILRYDFSFLLLGFNLIIRILSFSIATHTGHNQSAGLKIIKLICRTFYLYRPNTILYRHQKLVSGLI